LVKKRPKKKIVEDAIATASQLPEHLASRKESDECFLVSILVTVSLTRINLFYLTQKTNKFVSESAEEKVMFFESLK
jgi:hypothetical protein